MANEEISKKFFSELIKLSNNLRLPPAEVDKYMMQYIDIAELTKDPDLLTRLADDLLSAILQRANQGVPDNVPDELIVEDIAKQEARNEMLRAQGEQRAMENRIGEARRMQSMVAQGRAYEFETQENRTMAQLDRLAGLQTNYQTAANQSSAMTAQTLGTAIPNAVTAGLGVYNMMEG